MKRTDRVACTATTVKKTCLRGPEDVDWSTSAHQWVEAVHAAVVRSER